MILGILWMAICSYFCVSLSLGTYYAIKHTASGLDWVSVDLFFVLLSLVGTVASLYVFRGSRWGRVVVGVVALLIVTASVMGLYAWFNSQPFHSSASYSIFLRWLPLAFYCFLESMPWPNKSRRSQPPWPLRLQSTSRVGGGSAFYVRRHSHL